MVAPGALRQPRTGVPPGERGRRRTRQDQISLGQRSPVKLRTLAIRTERRKLISSAGTVFERANSAERSIQPFDLMSRRHPLSSIRAPIKTGFEKQIVHKALDDVPASSRRQFYQARDLLLLGDLAGLLRSLLHCALRLLCLLSFLGHVALLM